MSAKMYSTPSGMCIAALVRPHSVSILTTASYASARQVAVMMTAETTRSATKSFFPASGSVEHLEDDVAVASDEIAGRDEGQRDHRQQRDLAGADPADGGDVPAQHLVHDAEEDESEQGDRRS